MTDRLDPELARRTGTWVRALLGDPKAEAKAARAGDTLTKALGEGINTAGSFLVPSGIGAILDLRDQYGLFRRYAFRPPVQAEHATWPRLSATSWPRGAPRTRP